MSRRGIYSLQLSTLAVDASINESQFGPQTRAATSSRNEQERSNLSSVIAELEETRQHLEKANEERWKMTDRLASLREELKETKAELQHLKSWDRQERRRVKDIEIEDVKFVEEPVQAAAASARANEFQKKRYVTFANPPSLTRVLDAEERVLERHFSVDRSTHPQKKKKKKPLAPLIAALFTKKKDNQDGGFRAFPAGFS